MKTNIRSGNFRLTKYVLLFFIILLLQSCTTTSTSVMGIEGDDCKKNLPGLWVGKTDSGAFSKKIRMKILKIDGNEVNLTGSVEGSGSWAASEEVYGLLENSTLLITWPAVGDYGVIEKYIMKRDDSNNLILDGRWKSGNETGKSKLKKIE